MRLHFIYPFVWMCKYGAIQWWRIVFPEALLSTVCKLSEWECDQHVVNKKNMCAYFQPITEMNKKKREALLGAPSTFFNTKEVCLTAQSLITAESLLTAESGMLLTWSLTCARCAHKIAKWDMNVYVKWTLHVCGCVRHPLTGDVWSSLS